MPADVIQRVESMAKGSHASVEFTDRNGNPIGDLDDLTDDDDDGTAPSAASAAFATAIPSSAPPPSSCCFSSDSTLRLKSPLDSVTLSTQERRLLTALVILAPPTFKF